MKLRSAPLRAVRLLSCLASPILVSGSLACAGESGPAGANDLDAAPRIALEEVMRIGSVDDPDYGFTGINGVDVADDGSIFVFEAADAQFRVYSPDGELLRRIGRRGEGPGEFRSAPRFGIHGDTLWAIESFGRRISLFHLDGTVISTAPIQAITVPMQRMIGNVMPTAMRPDGMFTSDMTMFSSSRDMEITVGANDTVQIPRVLYNAKGEPVDTIGWMPRLPVPQPDIERVNVGDNTYMVPQRPSDAPLMVALADGRLLIERPAATSADPAVMTITRFDLADDTVFHRVYSYRPRPFDDAALARYAWQSARTPGGGIRVVNGVPQPDPVPDDSMDAYARIRGAMDFPPFQPPVRANRPAQDGSLWLMREEDGGELQRWTVIGADGELVGTVELDRKQNPMWSDGQTLFTVVRDELDVPWLVRYAMHRE